MTIDEVALYLKDKHNLLEEALALESLAPRRRSIHHMSLREIGGLIGKSYDWVRRRLALRKLPPEIQKAAEEGIFTATDLQVVTTLPKAKWNSTARRVMREKKAGKKVGIADLHKRTTRQTPQRMTQMLVYLSNKEIGGLVPRMVAWCMGVIDDKEIYSDIKEFLGDQDAED